MIASIFRWDEYEKSGFCQELGGLFPIAEGKLQPFHRSVTEWLTDPDKASCYHIDARNGHLRLSDYGWDEYKRNVKTMTDYMLDHLPAHLISVMRCDDAVTMLQDLAYFNVAWDRNEFMVENYWSDLEAKCGVDLVGSYRHIIESPAKYNGHTSGIANLLYGTGHLVESEALFDYLIPHFNENNELRRLKNAYEKKGLILTLRGDNAQAMAMFKNEERICRELSDRFGLQDCLMYQTAPLLNTGDMEGINVIVQEMEKNSWSMNKRQIARILHAKALFLAETGKLDESLKLYREKEKICDEIKDVDCFYMTYNNEALILYEKGDFEESLAVNKKFEKLCIDHGNKYALAMCLLNFAFVDYDLGKTYEAIGQLKKADDIARKLGHKLTVAMCLGNLAIIYQDTGKPGEAMKLHEEEMEISNEQNDKMGLAYALGNIALIRHDQGALDEALKLLKEKQVIAEKSSIVRSVQAAIGNEALVHFDRDELDEALRLHKLEESMCVQLGNKKELAICKMNQANVVYAKGLLDEAMQLYEWSEKAFREMGYPSGIQACLNGEALVLSGRSARDESLKRLMEAAEICRKIGNKKGLQSALTNQAAVHYALGNSEKASLLLGEAEKICAEIDYKEGIAIALMGKAIIAAFEDDLEEEALKLAHDAVNIVDTCGIWILAKKMHHMEDLIEKDMDSGGAGPGPIMWVVKKQKLDKNS
jgi:tetratricopeptide (TPR) repeat protein